MTREQFDRFVDGGLFERELRAGKTISNVTFETKGVDRDDDFVVFEFEDDPAAGPLRIPDVTEPRKG